MPTKEQIQAALKKHDGNKSAAARSLGMDRTTFKRRLAGAEPKRVAESRLDKGGPMESSDRSSGKSLAEFRAVHDKSYIIPRRIKEGLAKLGGGWEYEMPFAKMCGVSLGDLSSFRSMFEDHIVLIERTKRAWAGTVAVAARMRSMVA